MKNCMAVNLEIRKSLYDGCNKKQHTALFIINIKYKMDRKIEDIKAEIEQLLKTEPIDYSRFTVLSNELVKQDREHVRFSVDAAIINRLGKELVGRAETAISELIKNAYDAEASYAKLIFQNAYSSGGTLVIEDDGLGMTYDDLINGFMRISSSDKIHKPVSPNYKRKKAGKKGIGRFAAQRLGEKLIIVTQTADSELAIRATINWADFLMDSDVNEVSGHIEYIQKERSHGTTLYIEKLIDGWSDAAILRSYRYTEDLLIPEPLSRERKDWDENREDPGFKASFYRDTLSESTKVVDENIAFYDHALAIIDGYIDKEGLGHWRFWSRKLDVLQGEYRKMGKDREDCTIPYTTAHSIHFKTYYFIYERSLIPGSLFSYVKNLGSEIGGIRLYRNGFRVPPYGEKNNDWIGLDESVRRRTFIFPHQNQSFFGYVEIDDAASELFEETSSREGLIENQAFAEIQDFVYRAITTAGLEIAALRQRKQTANQKDWEKKNPSQNLKDAIEELSSLIDEETDFDSKENETKDDDTNGNRQYKNRRKQYHDVFEKIKSSQEKQESQNQDLLDKINMLRVLAGLGLAIGEFIHEIKYFFPGFTAELNHLKNNLIGNTEALERLALVQANFTSMESYLTFFDHSISKNARRILEPIKIKEEIKKFEDVIENDRKRANIDVKDNRDEVNVLLSDMQTIPMHPSEWASIFFNLYSNAKKAIKRSTQRHNGHIFIECHQNGDIIIIDFSDNGCGVDFSIKDHMFEAFVTTTSAASQGSTDDEVYTGTGLGLSILKDIIDSYDGKIYLLEKPKEGYATTFRIEIPKLKQ